MQFSTFTDNSHMKSIPHYTKEYYANRRPFSSPSSPSFPSSPASSSQFGTHSVIPGEDSTLLAANDECPYGITSNACKLFAKNFTFGNSYFSGIVQGKAQVGVNDQCPADSRDFLAGVYGTADLSVLGYEINVLNAKAEYGFINNVPQYNAITVKVCGFTLYSLDLSSQTCYANTYNFPEKTAASPSKNFTYYVYGVPVKFGLGLLINLTASAGYMFCINNVSGSIGITPKVFARGNANVSVDVGAVSGGIAVSLSATIQATPKAEVNGPTCGLTLSAHLQLKSLTIQFKAFYDVVFLDPGEYTIYTYMWKDRSLQLFSYTWRLPDLKLVDRCAELNAVQCATEKENCKYGLDSACSGGGSCCAARESCSSFTAATCPAANTGYDCFAVNGKCAEGHLPDDGSCEGDPEFCFYPSYEEVNGVRMRVPNACLLKNQAACTTASATCGWISNFNYLNTTANFTAYDTEVAQMFSNGGTTSQGLCYPKDPCITTAGSCPQCLKEGTCKSRSPACFWDKGKCYTNDPTCPGSSPCADCSDYPNCINKATSCYWGGEGCIPQPLFVTGMRLAAKVQSATVIRKSSSSTPKVYVSVTVPGTLMSTTNEWNSLSTASFTPTWPAGEAAKWWDSVSNAALPAVKVALYSNVTGFDPKIAEATIDVSNSRTALTSSVGFVLTNHPLNATDSEWNGGTITMNFVTFCTLQACTARTPTSGTCASSLDLATTGCRLNSGTGKCEVYDPSTTCGGSTCDTCLQSPACVAKAGCGWIGGKCSQLPNCEQYTSRTTCPTTGSSICEAGNMCSWSSSSICFDNGCGHLTDCMYGQSSCGSKTGCGWSSLLGVCVYVSRSGTCMSSASSCSACTSANLCFGKNESCYWSGSCKNSSTSSAATCSASSECSACKSKYDCLTRKTSCVWDSSDRVCSSAVSCTDATAVCSDCSSSAAVCYGKNDRCYYTSSSSCVNTSSSATCTTASSCTSCLSKYDCEQRGPSCVWNSSQRTCGTPNCEQYTTSATCPTDGSNSCGADNYCTFSEGICFDNGCGKGIDCLYGESSCSTNTRAGKCSWNPLISACVYSADITSCLSSSSTCTACKTSGLCHAKDTRCYFSSQSTCVNSSTTATCTTTGTGACSSCLSAYECLRKIGCEWNPSTHACTTLPVNVDCEQHKTRDACPTDDSRSCGSGNLCFWRNGACYDNGCSHGTDCLWTSDVYCNGQAACSWNPLLGICAWTGGSTGCLSSTSSCNACTSASLCHGKNETCFWTGPSTCSNSSTSGTCNTAGACTNCKSAFDCTTRGPAECMWDANDFSCNAPSCNNINVSIVAAGSSFDVLLNGTSTSSSSLVYTSLAYIDGVSTSLTLNDPTVLGGVTTTLTIENGTTCNTAEAKWTVVNGGEANATVGICLDSDSKIGTDEGVVWERLSVEKHGLHAQGLPFYIQAVDVPFSGTFAGTYGESRAHCSSNSSVTSDVSDSGICVNWNNIQLGAGATKVFRVVFSTFQLSFAEGSCASSTCESCTGFTACSALSASDCSWDGSPSSCRNITLVCNAAHCELCDSAHCNQDGCRWSSSGSTSGTCVAETACSFNQDCVYYDGQYCGDRCENFNSSCASNADTECHQKTCVSVVTQAGCNATAGCVWHQNACTEDKWSQLQVLCSDFEGAYLPYCSSVPGCVASTSTSACTFDACMSGSSLSAVASSCAAGCEEVWAHDISYCITAGRSNDACFDARLNSSHLNCGPPCMWEEFSATGIGSVFGCFTDMRPPCGPGNCDSCTFGNCDVQTACTWIGGAVSGTCHIKSSLSCSAFACGDCPSSTCTSTAGCKWVDGDLLGSCVSSGTTCTTSPWVSSTTEADSVFGVSLNGIMSAYSYHAVITVNSTHTATMMGPGVTTVGGVRTSMTVVDVDCHRVMAEWTLTAAAAADAVVGVCLYGDTIVERNEYAEWAGLPDKQGLHTVASPFFVLADAPASFSGAFAGSYEVLETHCADGAVTVETGRDVDSGIAVNWNGIVLPAGTTETFRLTFSNYASSVCGPTSCGLCTTSADCGTQADGTCMWMSGECRTTSLLSCGPSRCGDCLYSACDSTTDCAWVGDASTGSCTSTAEVCALPNLSLVTTYYGFDILLNSSSTTSGGFGYVSFATIDGAETNELVPDTPDTTGSVTTTLAIRNANCTTVVAEWTLVNTGHSAATVDVCLVADTCIDSNDWVDWSSLSDMQGLYTLDYPFYIQSEEFTGIFAGDYSESIGMCARSVSVATGVDSAISVSWNSITVPPFTSRVLRILFSTNLLNLRPTDTCDTSHCDLCPQVSCPAPCTWVAESGCTSPVSDKDIDGDGGDGDGDGNGDKSKGNSQAAVIVIVVVVVVVVVAAAVVVVVVVVVKKRKGSAAGNSQSPDSSKSAELYSNDDLQASSSQDAQEGLPPQEYPQQPPEYPQQPPEYPQQGDPEQGDASF